MGIVVFFLSVMISLAAWRLLRVRHSSDSTSVRAKKLAQSSIPAGTDAGDEAGATWSTLDDRQLTRLLTNSAPRSTTE